MTDDKPPALAMADWAIRWLRGRAEFAANPETSERWRELSDKDIDQMRVAAYVMERLVILVNECGTYVINVPGRPSPFDTQ